MLRFLLVMSALVGAANQAAAAVVTVKEDTTLMKPFSPGSLFRIPAEPVKKGTLLWVDEEGADADFVRVRNLSKPALRFIARKKFEVSRANSSDVAAGLDGVLAATQPGSEKDCAPEVTVPAAGANSSGASPHIKDRYIASSETLLFSANGLATLKMVEGLGKIKNGMTMPYPDANGRQSIGWGHLMSAAEEEQFKDGITMDQAEAFLNADVAKAVATVKKELADVPLSQSEFDVLVIFTYNAGNVVRLEPVADSENKHMYDEAGQPMYKPSKLETANILRAAPRGETAEAREARYQRAFNGILSFNKVRTRGVPKVDAGLQKRRAIELFYARHDRVPKTTDEADWAEMIRLQNKGIGRTGVKSEDTPKRQAELWRPIKKRE